MIQKIVALFSLGAAIAAILVPLLLIRNPILVYTTSVGNFLAPTENVYSVSFLNIGKAVANDVHCGISFSNEQITNHSYQMNQKPLESMTTENITANNYEIDVKYLNQDQGGSISVQTKNYESPGVSLFGDNNANGKNLFSTLAGKVAWWKIAVPAFFFLIALVIFIIWVTQWFVTRILPLYRASKPKDDCNKNNPHTTRTTPT